MQPGRAVILLHMKFDDASLSCRAFVAAWALTFEDVRRKTIDPEIALNAVMHGKVFSRV